MPAIELIYFNAGGGHRAAARAIEAVLAQGGGRWQVRSTNLFEILDPQGQFRRYAGIAPEDLYNLRLRKGWTAGLAQELKLLQASIRIARDILVQRLHAHWLRSAPDLVLSLIPNFNLALGASLQRALPEVPLVTLMTRGRRANGSNASQAPHAVLGGLTQRPRLAVVLQRRGAGRDCRALVAHASRILQPSDDGDAMPCERIAAPIGRRIASATDVPTVLTGHMSRLPRRTLHWGY